MEVHGVGTVDQLITRGQSVGRRESSAQTSRVGQEGVGGARQCSVGAEVERTSEACIPIHRHKARGASTKEDVERSTRDREASNRESSGRGTVTRGDRSTSREGYRGVGCLTGSAEDAAAHGDHTSAIGAVEQELTATDGCGSAVGVVTA